MRRALTAQSKLDSVGQNGHGHLVKIVFNNNIEHRRGSRRQVLESEIWSQRSSSVVT